QRKECLKFFLKCYFSVPPIYAEPRVVTDLKDCTFYHTMDIPGYGIVEGEFDLQDGVDAYLGNENFNGKRVLEIGPASGFLTFNMERKGADVVACDLSEKQEWDIVPYCQYDYKNFAEKRREGMTTINNAFWLAHKAFNSRAKVVYGSAYEIPEAIGHVDIATFCAILLHIRDPFLVIQKALKLTLKTAIVTELVPKHYWLLKIFKKLTGNWVRFVPNPKTVEPRETWWAIPPETMIQYLALLGFEEYKLKFHSQKQCGRKFEFYTIVATRTRDISTN
ncbi:MAG: hypothetical protein K8S27_01500, partial [Candidatus Omnitrophica bacterium]|nr:hypothetical protein [Candidatus Omnitrophota bacterium]